MRVALAALLLASAGCPGPAARPEARSAAAPSSGARPVAAGLPSAQPRHDQRLAWIGWHIEDGRAYVGACGRRTADLAERGRLAACRVHPAGAAPRFPGDADWTADPRFVRDETPADFARDGCRVWFQDLGGSAAGEEASALLVIPGAGAPRPLARWRPEPTVDGDYFALETSFSPDGRWLALVRTTVGIGDGERLIEVASIEVWPAPACR